MAQDPFTRLHTALRRDRRVSEKDNFGAPGFRISGKVFAIFWKGDLVLKLPQERAQALVASKVAKSWDPGHGREMKEWVAFEPRTSRRWLKLAEESRDFVAAGVSGKPRAATRRGKRTP